MHQLGNDNLGELPPFALPPKPETANARLSALASLLENLDEAPAAGAAPRVKSAAAHDNRLVQVRLGIASSLFAALRAKHAPTAAHCLRVALGCSSWSLAMQMSEEERDEMEVAALLHDVGKIGVPDQILRKPSKLTYDELALVDRHTATGVEILRGCTASQNILDTVFYASAWFDGSKAGFDRSGNQLPVTSRMLAIVDAFDSMTTDHVYRRAMSRERAMAELFECAGSQFDQQLVRDFCALHGSEHVKLSGDVARRWLDELDPHAANSFWSLRRLNESIGDVTVANLFQQTLLDNMQDAVVFVDSGTKIVLWNHAAERITGIPAASVLDKQWSPGLVNMRDEQDEELTDSGCPIGTALRAGTQNLRRLTIAGTGKRRISVDVYVVPVVGSDYATHGAALLLHDASSQITLEERVVSLHVKATQDPLTKVANRAEFDRVHEQFVKTHLEKRLPCSLIICDLDYFKRINDTYGHQAGDEALVSFAALLKRFYRPGDLVARYGGEEFVMLCADCDNETATKRAEKIRRELETMPQPMLNGRCITCSFGVTEIQDGDTPETMLRRADRALLEAKSRGRNTVVQLGAGMSGVTVKPQTGGWFSWFRSTPPDQILERSLVTPVPLNLIVEKLKGFVADQHAEIASIGSNDIVLKIDGQHANMLRRRTDRVVPFVLELEFNESREESGGRGGSLRTHIHVVIRPIRNRDRRRRDVEERARQLLVSLKSYLIAHDDHGDTSSFRQVPADGGKLQKAKNIFAPLFRKNA